MPATFVLIADPSPRAIAQRLRVLGREFRSWRPAWRAAAPLVVRGLGLNLTRQGSPLGEPWAPLRPNTLRRRARLGQQRTILIATGEHIAGPLARGGSVNISTTRMRIGVPRSRVGTVQHSGSAKRRIPARPVFSFSPPMEAAVRAAMETHARDLLARAERDIAALRRGT